MREWRHELGDLPGYEASGSSTQTKLEKDASQQEGNLRLLRVDEMDSESRVAAQLARVEAHFEEESWNSALTSMSVERRKNPGEKETEKQPGR